ncbi:MAG: hypothetical protein U0R78_05345 [Nocardioidaceae bacterium]
MYNDLPAGQATLSQMWSGDIVAVYYLPENSPTCCAGSRPTATAWSTTMMVLNQGKNPVAAHVFHELPARRQGLGHRFGTAISAAAELHQPRPHLVEDGFYPREPQGRDRAAQWFVVADRLLGMPVNVEQKWLAVLYEEFKAGA